MIPAEGFVLTGPTSSGKSSVACALTAASDLPLLTLDSDEVLLRFPYKRVGTGHSAALNNGLFAAARGFMDVGISVIVEQVFWSLEGAVDAACLLADKQVWLVLLSCDSEVADSRERARGNRTLGLASQQRELDWAALAADLVLDTTARTPNDVAAEILARSRDTQPLALQRLANQRAGQ